MRRFLFALATLLVVTATPTFAGYIIIRVLLEGDGSGGTTTTTGPGGIMTPPGPGGPKLGPNIGGSSGGPPGGLKGGPPPMTGGPMGGGTTTATVPGEVDHTRSVVVVIPLDADLKEEALEPKRAFNQNENPRFRKFIVPYYGDRLKASLFVDSTSIQLYEQLLDKPLAKKTRVTEMHDKYALWLKGKNDPQLLYDAMILALRAGMIREVPGPKHDGSLRDAMTFAQELLAVAAEGKPLPATVDRFVKVWGEMSKAVRAPALGQSDAEIWKTRLVGAKDVHLEGHYAIVYWDSPSTEVTRRARQLNDNFYAFYLFHAIRGVTLTVPAKPLVVVLASQGQKVHEFNRALDGLPIQSDAFYAPDHDLLVLSPERLDGVGQTFLQQAQQVFGKGLSRGPLLNGLIPQLDSTGEKGSKPHDVARATTVAVIEKLVIDEAEIAAVSREGTRQLLFATNQLPKYVTLPNWLTNGAVNYLARPRGPAYVTLGEDDKPYMHVAMSTGYDVPNYVLHRVFRDLDLHKELNADRARLFEHILTDSYFAGIKDGDDPDPAPPKKKKTGPGPVIPPKAGPGGSDVGVPGQPPRPMGGPGPMGSGGGPPPNPMGGPPPNPMGGPKGPMGSGFGTPATSADEEDPAITQRKKRERLSLKAQATAWALYYYLAREKPELLAKYISELNKLPRDLPIDGRTAHAAFVRVFGLGGSAEGTADQEKLKKFAKEWLDYMTTVPTVGFDIPLVVPDPPPASTSGPMGPMGPKVPMGSGTAP